MIRTISTLAVIALTAAVATAQPIPAKKLDPRAVSPNVVVPKPEVQANLPSNRPALQVDPGKFLKHNLRITTADLVINDAAKSVTVTVRNTGQVAETTVVRLAVTDAADGTLVLLDQTKGTGAIPAGGTKSLTFTGVDLAAFRQAVVTKFGNQVGNNKLFLIAIADPKKQLAETDETDNFADVFRQ